MTQSDNVKSFTAPNGTTLWVEAVTGGLVEGPGTLPHVEGPGTLPRFFSYETRGSDLTDLYRRASELLDVESGPIVDLQGGEYSRLADGTIKLDPYEGPVEYIQAESFLEWVRGVASMDPRGIVPDSCPWVFGPELQTRAYGAGTQVTLWSQGAESPDDWDREYGPESQVRVNFDVTSEGVAVFWRAPRLPLQGQENEYPVHGRDTVRLDELDLDGVEFHDREQGSSLRIDQVDGQVEVTVRQEAGDHQVLLVRRFSQTHLADLEANIGLATLLYRFT